MVKSKEPRRNVYVGHRYVPLIMGEWDKSIQYEGLSIVTYQGTSYTSKKRVPVGIDILNEEYWTVTGNYNAQVEHYRQEVVRVKNDMNDLDDYVKETENDLNNKITTNTNNISDLNDYVTNTESNLNGKITTNENNINEINELLTPFEDQFDVNLTEIDIKVPTDFSDLQQAIDNAKRKMNGIKVNIIIESGFKVSKGIKVSDGDYSNIIIKSVDDVVTVSDDFEGEMMSGQNASMPKLQTLFNMNNKGGNGYSLIDGSTGYIDGGCGVINAGKCCLYVRASILRSAYSKFSGGNDRCAWFTRGAVASMGNTDFSGCKGGNVAVYVSRSSIVEIANSDISNANVEMSAVYVVRSKLTAIDTNISNSSANGVFASQSSEVSLRNSDVTHAGVFAIQANYGTRIDLSTNTDLSNALSDGIHASAGSIVVGDNVIINDVGRTGAFAEENSKINIPNATILRPKRFGLWANKVSVINANNSVITDSGDSGVLADDGSTINIRATEINNSGNHGINATNTGTINALSCKINDSLKDGVNANSMSRINCRMATVKNSGTNDLAINFGSTIVGVKTNTTQNNGSPMYTDCNVSEFNSVLSNGILYV